MYKELVFSVKDIPPEGLRRRIVLDSTWFSLPEDANDPEYPIFLRGPIEVSLIMSRSGRDVRVKLELHTSANLYCARCLGAFNYRIHAATEFTYCYGSPTLVEGNVQLTPKDLELGFYQGDEIDLSELLYEQIVLSFPIKPLCRPDCPGLCIRCGADLNEGDCGCDRAYIDPRFEILKGLKIG